jgi:hypothetical protein
METPATESGYLSSLAAFAVREISHSPTDPEPRTPGGRGVRAEGCLLKDLRDIVHRFLAPPLLARAWMWASVCEQPISSVISSGLRKEAPCGVDGDLIGERCAPSL